jgi:predicted enzyme related to lactoylglutathione lyase
VASSNGKFTWYQLITTDPEAAAQFYASVAGWAVKTGMGPGHNVTVFEAAGIGVGNMMAMMDDMRQMGTPSHWLGFIGADDVDSVTECIAGAGGRVYHAPDDIEGIGRFAIVTDPQGATFSVFKPVPGMQRPTAPADAPGHIGWHELHATNWATAFEFYASLYGWTKGETHDMGPAGQYQLFTIGDGQMGGMANKMADAPMPFWLFYINVPDINQAAARVLAAGGKIVSGPHPVPGGSWILQAHDPQGAMFALVAPPH